MKPRKEMKSGFVALALQFGLVVGALAADPYEDLYEVLMKRDGPDEKASDENETSPTIFLLSDFPFDDKTYPKFTAALDAFGALPKAKIEGYSKVKRALLQRHLWKVFDATFPIPGYLIKEGKIPGKTRKQQAFKELIRKRPLTQDRRVAAQPKIASLIRRLALTREQILALPNTRVATAQSGGFPQHHNPKSPYQPFFPSDLYEKESSWICLGAKGLPIPASEHTEKLNWRSAFLSFMRLPGGRDDTLSYLQKMSHENIFPVGTQFALIEQAFLISDQGDLVLSPLIVSVSLRAYLNVTQNNSRSEPTQSVAEFVMQPRQLLQGNAVMKALNQDDHRYEAGIGDEVGREDDPFETDKMPSPSQSRLNTCFRCHVMGVTSLVTVQPHNVLRNGVSPGVIGKATSAKKLDHNSWKKLKEYWEAKPAR